MDCKYILQNEIHEKYLRGLLEDSEKTEYEKHLRECPSCQKEQQNQRILISGIRQIGRQEMKDEILRQVEQSEMEKTKTDWTTFLKIAAVIFLIIITPSLFYYFQVIAPQHKALSPEIAEKVSQEEKEDDFAVNGMKSETIKDEKSQKEAGTTGAKPGAPSSSEQIAIETAVSKKRIIKEKTIAPPKKSVRQEDDPESFEESVSQQNNKALISGSLRSRKSDEDKNILLKETREPLSSLKETEFQRDTKLESKQPMAEISLPVMQKKLSGKGEDKRKTADAGISSFDEVLSEEAASMRLKSEENQIAAQTGGKGGASLPGIIFKANEIKIQVHLLDSLQELTEDGQNKPPQTFGVKLLKKDSLYWEMNWYVNSYIFKCDTADMNLQILDDQIIQLNIQDRFIYKIDLKEDSTQAVLEK
jgi:hypothetical protein